MVINSMKKVFHTIVLMRGLDDIARLKTSVLDKISQKKGWPDAL